MRQLYLKFIILCCSHCIPIHFQENLESLIYINFHWISLILNSISFNNLILVNNSIFIAMASYHNRHLEHAQKPFPLGKRLNERHLPITASKQENTAGNISMP